MVDKSRNFLLRQHICVARKGFVDKLKEDLHNHGSLGYKLLKGPQGRSSDDVPAQLVESAAFWGQVWHEGENSLDDALLMARAALPMWQPEAISLKQFRWAAAHYPAKKSLGIDGWRAYELAMLPDGALSFFLKVVNRYFTSGVLDKGVAVNIMALLPKPQGVFAR